MKKDVQQQSQNKLSDFHTKRLPHLIGVVVMGLGSSLSVYAQTTSNPGTAGEANVLNEIVVTAQKRQETVQSVPITISAFNEATLTKAGITTPGDLQRLVPTFKFTSSIGTLAARLSIRGIGTFSNSAIEPSVAAFMDGIYIPRPASIVNSLLDIEGVEVLSGPQGTLFGRNASVGAISFRTGKPTGENSFKTKAEYSTGNHFRSESVANFAATETVAVRLAFLADTFDGYWKNDLNGSDFGGVDTYAGRVSVKADLTDDLIWTVRADTQQNKGDGQLNAKLIPSSLTPTTLARLTALQGGIVPNLNEFSKNNNSYGNNNKINDTFSSMSSDLSYTSKDDYTFRLLNGYNDWNSKQSDGDTASLSVYVLGRDLNYKSKSNSHELQFISPKDKLLGGKFDFVAGLYAFDEDLGIRADSLNGSSFCDVVIPLPLGPTFNNVPGANTAAKIASCKTYSGPSSRGDFNQNTKSLAGYGQASYKLTTELDLTLGARYTDEKKTGSYVGTQFNPTGNLIGVNENTDLSLKDSRSTYRTNLAWHPSKSMMVFGTVSNGFKSGGFNNGVATTVVGQNRVFKAETVKNYELGMKSQSNDRMWTFNATAYRMDIDNFQERSIVGLLTTIRNVGKVRQQGLDLEGVVNPLPNLRLNASASYVNSKILSFCNAPLPQGLTGPAPASCPGALANTQDLKGARLNYTPKWSGVVGAEVNGNLDGGMRWTLNSDVNYTSRQLGGTVIDNSERVAIAAYTLLNGRFTVYGPKDKWSVSLFGRNLTNKGYCSSTVYQVLEGPLGLRYDANGDGINEGTAVRCNLGAPRVLGLSASFQF